MTWRVRLDNDSLLLGASNIRIQPLSLHPRKCAYTAPLHRLQVGLFRDESVVRLVTTKFDRHFTNAMRERYPHVADDTSYRTSIGRIGEIC